MTESNSAVRRLSEIFRDTFHVEVPSPDTDLLRAGILDSFQFVELLAQIEKDLRVTVDIDDIDLDDLRTLNGISVLIEAQESFPRSANGATK